MPPTPLSMPPTPAPTDRNFCRQAANPPNFLEGSLSVHEHRPRLPRLREHDPTYCLTEHGRVEVDEEAELVRARTQVSEHLCVVDGGEPVDGFELDDQVVSYEKIEHVFTDNLVSIPNEEALLATE